MRICFVCCGHLARAGKEWKQQEYCKMGASATNIYLESSLIATVNVTDTMDAVLQAPLRDEVSRIFRKNVKLSVTNDTR